MRRQSVPKSTPMGLAGAANQLWTKRSIIRLHVSCPPDLRFAPAVGQMANSANLGHRRRDNPRARRRPTSWVSTGKVATFRSAIGDHEVGLIRTAAVGPQGGSARGDQFTG